jgi:hypothetical protein
MRKARLIVIAVFAVMLFAIPASADAAPRDRDHDGLPDKWEKKFHLSTTKKNARKDPDHDGLRNIGELRHRTSPRDADSDNDSLRDGSEIRIGDNPRDRDSDDDGVEDGDEFAGTVQSFDSSTGVLTILLADGQTTVSGTVNASTEIECENPTIGAASHGGDEGGNSGPGSDNSGPGSDNSGPGSGDSGRDEDEENACTTADLTPGRVVHEAELVPDGNGGFVFEKVELDR